MRYGELNVVIFPIFLFGIGNNWADSGLSSLMAKVATLVNKFVIWRGSIPNV
jgi:hypothetical protein